MIGVNEMLDLYKFMLNHVAVSSLESPEHAIRKDPKIITITWFMGKRCNYDCSYCSPYYHDNYSPHISKEKAFNFIDQLEKYSITQNKNFKINITGGEPFVHPNFIELLKYIKNKKQLTQLVVVSNGSVPLKTYIESTEYITNLTISLHLEQDDSVINNTVDKILSLNAVSGLFLNVNLMALPGKLEKIKQIINKFNENNIKFVLRKIDPPFENKDNFAKKGEEEKINEQELNFISNKAKSKNKNISNLDQRHKEYYSEQELEFVSNFDNKKQWNNIRLYNKDEIVEVNTDEIKARNLNSWPGWQCYIGVDSFYIQHNGIIFRGSCMQGGPIGKIGEKIDFPTQPIICPVVRCSCNADMVVRKVKNQTYNGLIND